MKIKLIEINRIKLCNVLMAELCCCLIAVPILVLFNPLTVIAFVCLMLSVASLMVGV